jgi:hypothetical protein
MSRKKSKKAVKKVVSSGVQRVPPAFDDIFVEPEPKGPFFWPLLRFDFHEHCPSGSESEFVDIDSFSDAAPKFGRRLLPTPPLNPLLLPLKLLFPSLLIRWERHPPNSSRNLSLQFVNMKILSPTFP